MPLFIIIFNILYIGAKLYCVIVSSSKAVTAALVDSIVDLVSQVYILMYTILYILNHIYNMYMYIDSLF